MKQLRSLYLFGNQITDLDPLMHLVKLKEVALINNPDLNFPEIIKLQKALPKTNIQHNTTKTKIQFINKTKNPVQVRWVNFGGELETYNEALQPNVSYTQNTYVGHQWILFTSKGKELGRTIATGNPATWEITDAGLMPSPKR